MSVAIAILVEGAYRLCRVSLLHCSSGLRRSSWPAALRRCAASCTRVFSAGRWWDSAEGQGRLLYEDAVAKLREYELTWFYSDGRAVRCLHGATAVITAHMRTGCCSGHISHSAGVSVVATRCSWRSSWPMPFQARVPTSICFWVRWDDAALYTLGLMPLLVGGIAALATAFGGG